MFYYSPSKNGLYNHLFKDLLQEQNNWPEDLIEIEEQFYEEMINSPLKVIMYDNETGSLLLSDPVLTDYEKLKRLQVQADTLLKNSYTVVLDAYEKGETVPLEWVEYRSKLKEVLNTTDFSENITLPTPPTE